MSKNWDFELSRNCGHMTGVEDFLFFQANGWMDDEFVLVGN